MNILAIDFSVDWFLTIPGMLITGGVLLLIIALVIFITSGSKKGKAKKEAVVSSPDMNMPPISQGNPAMNFNLAQNPVPDPNMGPGMTNPMPNMITDQPMVNPAFTQINPVEPSTVNDLSQGINMTSSAAMPATPMMGNEVNPVITPDLNMAPNVAPDFNPIPNLEQNNVPPLVATDSNMSMDFNTVTPQTSMMQPGISQFTNVQPEVTPVVPVTPEVAPSNMIMDTPIANSTVIPPMEAIVTPEVTMDVPIPTVEAQPSMESTVGPTTTTATTTGTPDISTNSIGTKEEVKVVETPQEPMGEAKTIYGGVEPVVPDMSQTQAPSHEIYGGANPLENTQPIPVVPRSAYQGVNPLPEEVSESLTPIAPTLENVASNNNEQNTTSNTNDDVEVLDF